MALIHTRQASAWWAQESKSFTVRMQGLVKAIKARIRRNSAGSVRAIAHAMNIAEATMRRLVSNNLGMQPFKFCKVHMLNAGQQQAWLEKCKCLLQRFAETDVKAIRSSSQMRRYTLLNRNGIHRITGFMKHHVLTSLMQHNCEARSCIQPLLKCGWQLHQEAVWRCFCGAERQNDITELHF